MLPLVSLDATAVPDYLVNVGLAPNVFVGGLIATVICIVVFALPFAVAGYGVIAFANLNFTILIAIGMEWLGGWVTMLYVMTIASLFTFRFIGGLWRG